MSFTTYTTNWTLTAMAVRIAASCSDHRLRAQEPVTVNKWREVCRV